MNRALIYRQGKPTELPGFPPAAPHRRSTGHMGPLSADAGHPASQHFSLTFIKRGTGNRNTQVYFQTTLKKKKKSLATVLPGERTESQSGAQATRCQALSAIETAGQEAETRESSARYPRPPACLPAGTLNMLQKSTHVTLDSRLFHLFLLHRRLNLKGWPVGAFHNPILHSLCAVTSLVISFLPLPLSVWKEQTPQTHICRQPAWAWLTLSGEQLRNHQVISFKVRELLVFKSSCLVFEHKLVTSSPESRLSSL